MYKFRTQFDEQKEVCVELSHKSPSLVEPGAHGIDIPAMLDLFEKTKDLNILGLSNGVQVMSEEEQQEFLRSESSVDDPTAEAIDVFEELQEQQGVDSQAGQIQVPSSSAEQSRQEQSKTADAAAKGFEQGDVKSPADD